MIRSIVKFCIEERLIVILVAMLVVAIGWFSLNSVPLDAIPNVGDNQVIVLADWPGQSPKDVEDQLTYPLSVALQAVPGAISFKSPSTTARTSTGRVHALQNSCFLCLRGRFRKA